MHVTPTHDAPHGSSVWSQLGGVFCQWLLRDWSSAAANTTQNHCSNHKLLVVGLITCCWKWDKSNIDDKIYIVIIINIKEIKWCYKKKRIEEGKLFNYHHQGLWQRDWDEFQKQRKEEEQLGCGSKSHGCSIEWAVELISSYILPPSTTYQKNSSSDLNWSRPGLICLLVPPNILIRKLAIVRLHHCHLFPSLCLFHNHY